ncbi:hypothetical protein [Chryseolinea lacunae]|uniref:Uncharacterized protein n=1 Tax=Chryseolinea lacunae TaxID=2801331 RepID=A0ABS1KTK8_9BACT|nr:hypothetical protein [Chryseolinea lacunae]MBL0742592.1 hypothetical protein [Chryseolinea lacunae]
MAKESIAKENPVIDVLKRLKDEEAELMLKLKPVQEAIGALEKIVDKSVKKVKSSSGGKDGSGDGVVEENVLELSEQGA